MKTEYWYEENIESTPKPRLKYKGFHSWGTDRKRVEVNKSELERAQQKRRCSLWTTNTTDKCDIHPTCSQWQRKVHWQNEDIKGDPKPTRKLPSKCNVLHTSLFPFVVFLCRSINIYDTKKFFFFLSPGLSSSHVGLTHAGTGRLPDKTKWQCSQSCVRAFKRRIFRKLNH